MRLTDHFAIAPRKWTFVKRNRLLAISLIVPAFGALRLLRLLRFARRLRFLRFLSSTNRGLRALRLHMRRRRLAFMLRSGGRR